MRVYSLTKLGEQVAVKANGNNSELKVLRYMYSNRRQPVTENEIDSLDSDGRFILRRLKNQNLIVELTSG